MTAAPLRLIVNNLAQARGGRTVFADLSFVVSAGEALVLTGPNGAGKTTLIRTLAGLIPPTTGTMTLEGGDTDQAVAEQVHYIGHANAIKPAMTVAENAAFWSHYLGGSNDGAEALAELELTALAAIPAGYLSAGQKRRLGLTRLLVTYRPVWLLDEPTVSLDAANRDRVAVLVRAQLARGGLVIAATHLPLGLVGARELSLAAA
jgi:heme exporter protein A